ncbi:hypothetical protein E4P40_00775 [Blastococcus sp. CT_GayMR20]|uniref:hypothetical protein n=1 Tax=Blastococcus sp. CT_GayMR20 TaxID=2559609 RepID=UPI001073BC04|nr:hypothetical protein [Blastococcus sp. CT_GayMR20]TFV92952.1 hypothetical protein E4P40_00775 [Blastococcus sp. CT_GayMR20]
MHVDLWQRGPRNDLTVAGGLRAAGAVGAGVTRLARAAVVDPATATAAGVLRLGWQLVPGVSGHPVLAELSAGAERVRNRLEHAVADALRALLRRTVDAALTAIDLTELVRAHVDLDALAADIDVDAVIARADIDAVVARADVDAIVQTVDLDAIVGRVDVEAIVRTIDLDAIVDRVDLDRVASRIDLDAIVARVDIDQIASGIDLDAIIARIDPDAVVARVDVEAVLDRLDLPTIARQVIEGIDLPAVLRQSTGAVSSQAARVVRTEGMNADDSVARFIDRVLRRPRPPGAVTA